MDNSVFKIQCKMGNTCFRWSLDAGSVSADAATLEPIVKNS
jgi:hypothetical protein